MINKADVVTINIPFQKIHPSLALREHMFICLQEGKNKEFVICQTFKPTHLLSCRPPYDYLVEEKNENRNPFSKKTTINCDKSFCVSDVIIDKALLTYRNICKALFKSILSTINHDNFYQENLEPAMLCRLNFCIYPKK